MDTLLHHFSAHDFSDWMPFVRTALRVLLIVAIAAAAQWLARRLIRAFNAYMAAKMERAEDTKRVQTLARVFRYLATVIITVVAGMLVLAELGVSIAPVLGAAGVVGIAIGFGAQSLVKDYFTGFFLLMENQVRQGDMVEAGGKSGRVEEVTLRYLRLRDYEGNVHFVPNGLITTVTNSSVGFAYAVVDLGVAYREDLDVVYETIRETARRMREDPQFAADILDDVEIAGVEKWADSAVVIRCRIKVAPLEQWDVRRHFLKLLKLAFDERGIEIPFPHLTLCAGQDRSGNAPSFRVIGSASGETAR